MPDPRGRKSLDEKTQISRIQNMQKVISERETGNDMKKMSRVSSDEHCPYAHTETKTETKRKKQTKTQTQKETKRKRQTRETTRKKQTKTETIRKKQRQRQNR